MRPRHLHHLLFLLLLAPTAVYADGVSPILNFFHKDTWIPASIVTLVIIVLESCILRWRIKTTPFLGALWRSFLLNAASSIAGSVLLIAVSRDSFFLWDTMSLVLPLFLITLATEIPLLRVFYAAVPLSWKRAAVLGLGLNVASYLAVFVLEIGLFVGWLSYAGHLDKRELAEWRNSDLLHQASGLIYATESMGANHGLRVYDCQTRRWASLTNCPSIDPNKWDVQDDLLAFVKWTTSTWEERHIVLVRLPEFKQLLNLSPTDFADTQLSNWQGATELAISPDKTKCAILFRLTDAVAPKDRSSYFDLGSKCRLLVVDAATGKEAARASRWASDHGLCWLADSRQVLFTSFDDESLYRTTKAEVHGSTSYGIGYARDGRFKRSLYAFDVDTGRTTRFADGYAPSLASATGGILVREEKGLGLLDSSGKLLKAVDIRRLGFRSTILSPSGELILAEIQRHAPFHAGGRLVLCSLARPEIRHILDERSSYRVDWTTTDSGMTSQEVKATR